MRRALWARDGHAGRLWRSSPSPCVPATPRRRRPGCRPTPIPPNPLGSAPGFEGAAATPRPIKGVKQPPRHPFMAPNGRSNLHDDAYQTDTYEVAGRSATAPRSRTSSPASAARSLRLARAGSSPSASGSTGRCWRCSTRTRCSVLAAMPLPPATWQSGSQPLHRLLRRRLLLPRPPRPGGGLDQRAPRARGRDHAGPGLRGRRATTTSPARSPRATGSSRCCPTGAGGSGS